MDKFGRKYNLAVQLATESAANVLQVALPFTLEFDITRNVFSSANVSSFRLYNLSEANRNKIRHNWDSYDDIRQISLKAGYGDNLPFVFSGQISAAWSVREGVNFITQIESFDGGDAYVNSTTAQQFPSGTAQKAVIDTLVTSLNGFGVKKGAIGDFPGTLPRGNSYTGSTVDTLNQLTRGGFFIDNGTANCLNYDEYIDGGLLVIDSSVGLLNTPVRQQNILTFDMIFEPRFIIGQAVQLRSQTASNFNGNYKIISLHHRGTISESVCGDAITTVGLLAPPELRLVK